MLAVLGFLATILLVTTLIHLYLWKRLIRDTTRPGRVRRIGGLVIVVLAVSIPATMAASRAGGGGWLIWPGYLWLALMFYLLLLLAALEIPMLVAKLWLRRRRAPAAATPTPAATPNPAAAPNPIATPHPVPAPTPVAARSSAAIAPSLTADAPGSTADATGAAAASAAASSAATTTTTGAGHDPTRRLLLARGAAIFAGLTATGIVGYGTRVALGPPTLDRVRIPLAKLPRAMDGFRIALVSDIHLGPLSGRTHCERVVAAINSLDADLVAVVGDLVDGSVEELGAAAAPLRDLRSRHGSFFVTGNHEYYSGYEQWIDEVTRLGMRPLRNERVAIAARGGALDLAGVNDLTGDGFGDAPDFAATFDGRDPQLPVVLLAHQPVQVREAAKHGVDLQLSGHTHGGQIVPFSLVVRLQQPVLSGLAEIDGTQVYVTNGAGFWGPPVRVGAPPQVTLVELRAP